MPCAEALSPGHTLEPSGKSFNRTDAQWVGTQCKGIISQSHKTALEGASNITVTILQQRKEETGSSGHLSWPASREPDSDGEDFSPFQVSTP